MASESSIRGVGAANLSIAKTWSRDRLRRGRRYFGVLAWILKGAAGSPPHIVKEHVIKSLGKRFGVSVLIETGTYLGDMIDAVKGSFREVYSIELSPELASRAVGRFAEYPSVKIVCGDSGKVLPELLKQISEPCLFWLDGHYSGGTTARGPVDYPVLEELHHIRSHRVKSHIIVIDDARLFDVALAPSLEQIYSVLREINRCYSIHKRWDMIMAHPENGR